MALSNNHSCGSQWQSNGQGGKEVCIFRVPQPIKRCENKEAYDPSIVSLGPYHKDLPSTAMYQHKLEAVQRMARRIHKTEEFLVAEVKKKEKEIREHYEEPIETEYNEEDFSSMMTNDACFIIEFFKCAAEERNQNGHVRYSPIFQNKGYKNSMHSAILTDIMKLENQVPLCVLIALLQLQFHNSRDNAITELECNNSRDNVITELECNDNRDKAITELAAILSNSNLFRKGFPFVGDDGNSQEENDDSINLKLKTHMDENGARHLLDLYRMVITDRLMPPNKGLHSACVQISHGGSLITPCANKFENAGIEFQPGTIRFEKAKFGNSKLFLPQITVKYRTETLLRNLIAYEECQRCSLEPKKTVVSNYVCLLDRLIDSEKDVAVLRDSEVIRSFVGSDEVVVHMFNNLTIGITIEPPDGDTLIGITIEHPDDDTATKTKSLLSVNEFEVEMGKAIQHYNSKWKVLFCEFQQAHFSKPWYTVSLLAAIALLIMTVIQTVYAVK